MHKSFTKTCGVVVLALVGFALWLGWPSTPCSAEWVNSAGEQISGPFQDCAFRNFGTRRIGYLDYAQFGREVYRVALIHERIEDRSGFGLGMRRYRMIKLDGAPGWGRLQSYLDGRYLSDGDAIFDTDGHRVLALRPALRLDKLRRVPGPLPGSRLTGDYATDGHWVIVQGEAVPGADAATFQQTYAIAQDGAQEDSHTTMIFGRDKSSVYHGAMRLADADPDSFAMISYNVCRNPPASIQFGTDQVALGAGWVAVDRAGAWEVDFTGVRRLDVDSSELQAVREDLRKAIAASVSSAGARPPNDPCPQ